MAKKKRTITSEEEYDVCDLCGDEINLGYRTSVGNMSLSAGDEKWRYFTVHLGSNSCVAKLVAREIDKQKKR